MKEFLYLDARTTGRTRNPARTTRRPILLPFAEGE